MRPISIVVGLGKTGVSCVRFLVDKGFHVAAVDSRAHPPGLSEFQQTFPQVNISLGNFDIDFLSQADYLVVSPGLSLREPAIAACIQRDIKIIGDIELFAQYVQVPVVAVTGTNGKSTVIALLGEMVRQAKLAVCVGGNIGTPVLDLLAVSAPAWYVLELSSFQLDTTHSLKLKAATILNISDDHLDRHLTLQAYHQAKQRIFLHAEQAIVNHDDKATFPPNDLPMRSFTLAVPQAGEFGIRNQNGQTYLSCGHELLLLVSEMKLKGQHNWANALAALAMGQAMALPMPAMLMALQNFPGLDHRCQWLREVDKVNWINDSKATNVGACVAALYGLSKNLTGKIILIAGGQSKGADLSGLKNAVSEVVRHLIVFGEDASLLIDALQAYTSMSRASDLQQAVALAKQNAQPGDIVLFAPACASFDMFKNFEHRGEMFSQWVAKL
ncbi:MAG: UDP-N-acetylmuramoyl-L-alanine--D-glutamate ligase [Gammaproteobacteria bacterium]